jgi:hypothetical protein
MSEVVDFLQFAKGRSKKLEILDQNRTWGGSARMPIRAPGYTVYIEDISGTEALNYPCEDGSVSRQVVCPGIDERGAIIDALKEALAFLGNPVADA